jgi:hypothetical protein
MHGAGAKQHSLRNSDQFGEPLLSNVRPHCRQMNIGPVLSPLDSAVRLLPHRGQVRRLPAL